MNRPDRSIRYLFLLILLCAAPGRLQARSETPLARRVEAIREFVNGKKGDMTPLFHPAFLKKVPPSKLKPVFVDFLKKGGKVVSVLRIAAPSPHFGEYRFYSKKMVFPVKIGVSSRPPHKIQTLWFGAQAPNLKSFGQLITALKKLPGKVSFGRWRLGTGKPRPVHTLNPNSALAIGSTFKLYVLGALMEDVELGKRRWSEVTTLVKKWRSWPSGVLHSWPVGASVTLNTLANGMISISDNTATDHLLFLLGRKRVEKMLGPMGNRAVRNLPFLSTREMFLLKASGSARRRLAEYGRRNLAGKRKYLSGVIAKIPRESFVGFDGPAPLAIDRVEWFASAADLCRAMDWLRRRSAKAATRTARGVLSINKGLSLNEKKWKFVGYKGGSEPGVLNLTWLLQRKDGAWFALSAGWNDRRQPLEEKKLFRLLQSAIILLER